MTKEIISITPFNNADISVTVPSGLVNSGVAVIIGTHQGTISTVTWNGVSLTKIAEGASSLNECGSLWLMVNPTPGTGNIVVTMSGGSWYGGTAIVLQGIKQTTTLTFATNPNGNSSTASISIIPPEGSVLILAANGSEAATSSMVPASAQLFTQQGQSFENYGGGIYSLGTNVPQVVQFNLGSGQRWGAAAMCIQDPSAGAEFGNIYRHMEVGNGMSRSEGAT